MVHGQGSRLQATPAAPGVCLEPDLPWEWGRVLPA